MKRNRCTKIRTALHAAATATIIAALVGVPLGLQAQLSNNSSDLDLLLTRKDYQKLERALTSDKATISPQDLTYFEGEMANRLNMVDRSMQLLEPMVSNLLMTNPLHAENALCTLADDYAKSSRYGQAAATYAQAARVSQVTGTNSSCDAAGEATRWALLNDAPSQTVETHGPFSLMGKKDALGLVRVPVTLGRYKGNWVVDTAANLSVISRSTANQLGLKTSAASGNAEGTSGVAIAVRVAVVPELILGAAVIHNVPVLVAEDSDLTFPSLNYQIQGCIGLPVLAALGSMTISENEEVRFGYATADHNKDQEPHNLFLERSTPVIVADFGRGDQLFAVDTGAIETMLSVTFYEEVNANIESSDLRALELVGAGGSFFTPAYQLHDITAKVAGDCIKLQSVLLLTQKSNSTDDFYGNIGQSLLSSFASYTFDFHQMYFSVSGGVPQANCSN
jgi:predicted aspartyl protease